MILVTLIVLALCALSYTAIRHRFVKSDGTIDVPAIERQILYETGFTERTKADLDIFVSSVPLTYVHYPRQGGLVFNSTGSIVAPLIESTNIKVSNDIFITSRPHCYCLYMLEGSSVTTITVANQYELLCGTMSMINESWFNSTTDKNGNNGRITYVGKNTHIFMATLTGCLQQAVAGGSTIKIKFFKNGNALVVGNHSSSSVSNQGEDFAVSFALTTSLTTNDYLEIFVTSTDGDDISNDNLQVNVFPID